MWYIPTSSVVPIGANSIESDDYLVRLQPRVPELLHTAPVYDDLTEPVSFPRIAACVTIKKVPYCQCYTQQATKLSVRYGTCLSIVKNGYFDPSVPDTRLSSSTNSRRPVSSIR